MTTNRRDFLKTGFIGAGLLSAGMFSCVSPEKQGDIKNKLQAHSAQGFNMCGYAAPKLDKVRVGFIGIGQRGTGAVSRFAQIEGVEIVALCDKLEERVERSQELLESRGLSKAKSFSGSEDAWKKMCEDPEIDLVYICTPWSLHTPMALYGMENGKHVAVEVPAAKTVEEAWQLVETSERTRKHCMMLENCCYDFFELLTLNMARQGYFGEIIHCEGAYIHDLLELNFSKDKYVDMWRLKENMKEGNLYPTHGLGPVCQILNINRGDQMEYLTAMQSADFMMAEEAAKRVAGDEFYKEFEGKKYRGNINNTLIKTIKGKTMLIQHDVTSPRPYSRLHLISGTKGMAQKYPLPARISKGHGWLNDSEFKAVEEQFTPEIVKHVGELAKKVGGHGGMDFLMDWRLVDCLRNGLPLDQDVYDAASWSVIVPLSEMSVNKRSGSMNIPDFTCGSWKTNAPVELTLKGGGTTGVVIKKIDENVQLSVG